MSDYKIEEFSKKRFLLKRSRNSSATYHSIVWRDGTYELRISDCHKGITLHGDLSNNIGHKEFIEKMETLRDGIDSLLEHVRNHNNKNEEITSWLVVNKDNTEYIFDYIPERYTFMCCKWVSQIGRQEGISLPKGTIKKLIGRTLTWEDDPVGLK